MDLAAAVRLQDVRQKLRSGPWNTGEIGAKGFVVTEPLAAGHGADDNIKRYTDRYLRFKTIGRTVDDYPFTSSFLSPELHRAVGLKRTVGAANANSDTKDLSQTRLANIASEVDRGEGEDAEKGDEEDGENEDEDGEDEFEEMDDDDYNAEKYFDDGDDDDGDDGDNEAAY